MKTTRRTFFSRLFGAAAAATALPKILQAAKTLGPAQVSREVVPDPLDARNWGKAQTAPIDFYKVPELTITGIDVKNKVVTLNGMVVRADPRVPPNTIEFYAAAGACSIWPETARIVNIAPPAVSQDELRAGRKRLFGDPVVEDPGEWRRGLYTFSPPSRPNEPGWLGLDRAWSTAPPVVYGADDVPALTATEAYERARRANARYIDRSLRESFWRG